MPVIREAARMVQRSARDIVPVGTPESTGVKGYVGGTLKASIQVNHLPKQQSSVVYTTTEYAPYVEFGTRKMRAQPFMRPAIEVNRDPINENMKNYLRDQMEKRKS